MTVRLNQRATTEYGNGAKRGEYTKRPGLTSRKPLVPRHQFATRCRTREKSRTPGARTPVFSTNNTRLPAATSDEAIW